MLVIVTVLMIVLVSAREENHETPRRHDFREKHSMVITTSRRRILSMVLVNMFSLERGQPLSSVMLFVWSLVTLGWFVNSSTDLVAWFGGSLVKIMTGGAWDLRSVAEYFRRTLAPALLLVFTIMGLCVNYRRNQEPSEVVGIAPEPHRGLIVQLGVYTKRDSRYANPDQLSEALASNTLDFGELLKSNFGPFALAARYHSPLLQHCWILTTGHTEGTYPLVEKLIKCIAGNNVECSRVSVADPNDIGLTARVVRSIYLQDKLPARDIMVLLEIEWKSASMAPAAEEM